MHLCALLNTLLGFARLALEQCAKRGETRQVDQQRLHRVAAGAAHAHGCILRQTFPILYCSSALWTQGCDTDMLSIKVYEVQESCTPV